MDRVGDFVQRLANGKEAEAEKVTNEHVFRYMRGYRAGPKFRNVRSKKKKGSLHGNKIKSSWLGGKLAQPRTLHYTQYNI